MSRGDQMFAWVALFALLLFAFRIHVERQEVVSAVSLMCLAAQCVFRFVNAWRSK